MARLGVLLARALVATDTQSLSFTTGKRSIKASIRPGEHRALVLLLGFTGLRFGEAAALTVGDIDLEHGRVRVHRSVTGVGR